MKGGEFKKAVQILAGTYDKDILSIEVATITSVDTSSGSPTQWTCAATPESGIATTPITGILLSAVPCSNGFILVPAVGSNVILAITTRNDVYVLMTSEVDQLIFYRDNNDGTFQKFTIDSSGITMGDGSFGGLVKLVDTSNPSNGLLTRINAIESFIKTLQTAINTWVPNPGDGGAALKTALTTWLGSTAPSTNRGMLENTKIVHGIPIT